MTDAGRVETRHVTGVLVIGAGGAGLRAAIAARDRGIDALVVAKRRVRDAHTVLAAGGINAALGSVDPEDSWQQHAADTLKEGYWLGNPVIVERLCREAPRAIEELVEWGVALAREPDGRLSQRYFGAHRWRRTCFAGDYTGREIQRVLVEQAVDLGVAYHEGVRITDLLVDDGNCFGAYGFDSQTGYRLAYLADAVILAAGGHTRIWRRSSSRRDENTGDGLALALRAGCRLADVELIQFHPTGMTWPEEIAGTLVTEAVRGEGGVLRNAIGERFMKRYDPERLELSTRDRVALANYTEIQDGRGTDRGGVLLDVSHLGIDHLRERLPRMLRQFLDLQMLDISREAMEVAPTAHYSMGGVAVAPDHETDVHGLYAVGEVASGVHGANRLGGNSLAEVLVFGRIAGEAAADRAASLKSVRRSAPAVDQARARVDRLERSRGEQFVRPLQRQVRDAMWEGCGVVRDDAGLRDALRRVEVVADRSRRLDVRPDLAGYLDLVHAFDLEDAILAARATILGALERRETRGAHIRRDFPDLAPAANLLVRLQGDALALEHAPVPAPSAELREAIGDSPDQYTSEGRLLE